MDEAVDSATVQDFVLEPCPCIYFPLIIYAP